MNGSDEGNRTVASSACSCCSQSITHYFCTFFDQISFSPLGKRLEPNRSAKIAQSRSGQTIPLAWLVERICFCHAYVVVLLSSTTAKDCGTKMNGEPERVLAVFTEALPLPAAERSGFLDRACAGDDELRRRVEGLLRSLEKAGDFLGEAAAGVPTGTGHEITAGEKPGDVIGPYKLLQQIGEGGCGVVFMAEQEAPVRRRVAVKVVKPGMDSKNVIARFEAERACIREVSHWS
jgi:hypothetical protein